MKVTYEALRFRIEGIYVVFKRYELRPHIEGCPHCVGERDHALLYEAPLRELTSAHLGKYGFKAMTTWGDADDFRHFLPRILELVACDAEWPVEPEIVLGKLAYADWNSWPAKQRRTIHEFLSAWWLDFLTEFPPRVSGQEADDLLCGLGAAEDDLAAYLRAWLADSGTPARRHLATFVCHNYSSLAKKGRLQNAFWSGCDRQREQVERWIRDSNLRGALDCAARATSNAAIQGEFLQAIDYLDWLRI